MENQDNGKIWILHAEAKHTTLAVLRSLQSEIEAWCARHANTLITTTLTVREEGEYGES
jgi:hypothetical protein